MMRGDLWWVDLGVPVGSAVGYRRPAIILQANEYNATELNTVVVVPLSSNLRLADYVTDEIYQAVLKLLH